MADEARYTLGEAGQMLGVDAKTLRDWIDKAGVTPSVDRYDGRRRYVTGADLQRLAEAHERIPRRRMTLADALRRIRELEDELAVLNAVRTRSYTPVALSASQEDGVAVADDESIDGGGQKRPQTQRRPPAPRRDEGEVKRNADGEYHFGDGGLTYDEQGLLTDRAFARIAADHGAKFETARQSWARSIPNSMRGSRPLAVQWMLTNRRSYLTAQCTVANCPCQAEMSPLA